MPENDLVHIFIRPLNRLNIRYMITGSVAATVYGEPRLTHDVDLVIEIDLPALKRFEEIFPLESYSVPPIEVLRIEASRAARGHCNIIHFDSGLKGDIYFMGRDPLHHWAIEGRRALTLSDEQVWLAPPEYVILRKLMFYREGGSEKHLRDIRLILTHSKDQISEVDLNERIKQLGLEQEFRKAEEFRV